MLRDAVFRSGIPVMIASVCVLATMYLAAIRGERLARYWAVAWMLLVVRYIWNGMWGTPVPNLTVMTVGLVLRVAFAASILGGVSALRGERFPARWIVALSLMIPLAAVGFQVFLFDRFGVAAAITTVGTVLLLSVASWRLATAGALPAVERIATAIALTTYALSSGISWALEDGSKAFATATMLGWSAQLLIGVGLLATFLRLSHDKEVAWRLTMESRLTEALGEFVHLCMHCKAVRDEHQQWHPLERFVTRRTSSQLSHGVCNDCARRHYPDDWSDLQGQSA